MLAPVSYNVFNHSRFSNVNRQLCQANYGAKTSTTFGQVSAARVPRIMQGSLRVSF